MAFKYNLASSLQYIIPIKGVLIPFYNDMHAENRTTKHIWMNYIC